jgi:predicted heme/steroid binding protein
LVRVAWLSRQVFDLSGKPVWIDGGHVKFFRRGLQVAETLLLFPASSAAISSRAIQPSPAATDG